MKSTDGSSFSLCTAEDYDDDFASCYIDASCGKLSCYQQQSGIEVGYASSLALTVKCHNSLFACSLEYKFKSQCIGIPQKEEESNWALYTAGGIIGLVILGFAVVEFA